MSQQIKEKMEQLRDLHNLGIDWLDALDQEIKEQDQQIEKLLIAEKTLAETRKKIADLATIIDTGSEHA